MMPSTSAMTYATALMKNELFASPGLQRNVPKVLAPDEEVLLALPGVAGDFPYVLIVTVQRVVLAQVTVLGAKVKRQVFAQDVTGVRYRPGIFTRVKVHVAGGRDISMVPHRKVDAERFAQAFSELLSTGRLPD